MKRSSRLTRPVHRMPAYIKNALIKDDLMKAYKERPPYQQNDYVGWITRAVRKETKVKRLNQMLDELRGGAMYMKMAWKKEKSALTGAIKKTCSRGHAYTGSGPCPVCWPGRIRKQRAD